MVTIRWLDLQKGVDLIDGPETTRFGETRLSGKDFSGLLGIGIVVRKSERRNTFARWWTWC